MVILKKLSIRRRRSNLFAPTVGEEGGRGRTKKINDNIFQTGLIQYLHLEFRNKSQMVLLPQRNRCRNTRQCSHERFVVCSQLKGMTFTEMAKMSDCCMCSQQFMLKRRVTRLHVGQFFGEKPSGRQCCPGSAA
jgi:hypothetical protein